MSTPVAPRQLVVKSRRTNMYTPLSPNSKLTGMGGRPRARDKMWTLQLWVWGRGVRGKCIMQLSLLSCHIVLPPRVWTLFVRAPSGLHVFGGFSLLPCLHVCAHFSVCSCMRMLASKHTIIWRCARIRNHGAPAGPPRDNPRGHDGQPTGLPPRHSRGYPRRRIGTTE